MTDSPHISVIIPTYDRPELLIRCVESILRNEYEQYEIIIIDQEVSQTLGQILRERFPSETRLKYAYLDRGGASRARNMGIQRASGEIVAFIDDDAVAVPGWLRAIAEAFEYIQPAPALIGGRIDPIWPGERPHWYPRDCEYLLGLYNIGDELRPFPTHDQPIGANMAGRRDVVMALGGFDEDLGPNYFRKRPMVTGEEAILGLRARKAGYELYYQPAAKVYHQISEQKVTVRYFLRRHFWEGVTIISEMYLLGDLNSGRRAHFMYHSKVVGKSLIKWLFPNLRNPMRLARPVARMLALSHGAYSLGVLYGLMTLHDVGG